MILTSLAACGQAGNGGSESSESPESTESAQSAGTFDPSSIKTMGDAFPYESEEVWQEGYSDTLYHFVFVVDGVYYRALAEMPQDVSEAVWGVDFEDEDRDAKIRELVSPLEAKVENLSEMMPTQEELDKYAGMTGQDLFDKGWNYWYYNLEDMEAGMSGGLFSYVVTFEYDGEPMVNSDDFDFYEEFKDLKIKSVVCDGIADAGYTE